MWCGVILDLFLRNGQRDVNSKISQDLYKRVGCVEKQCRKEVLEKAYILYRSARSNELTRINLSL